MIQYGDAISRKLLCLSTDVWFLSFYVSFCFLPLCIQTCLNLITSPLTNCNIGLMYIFFIFNVFIWMEKQNIFYLYLWLKLSHTKEHSCIFFNGSLAFAKENPPISVSQRIGEVEYFSRNKSKISLLMINRKERKNSINFVYDFPVFCICQTLTD